jgi:hypothetical protein
MANFCSAATRCGRFVLDPMCNRWHLNPAHFKGDVVTLRCTCNADNRAVTRCCLTYERQRSQERSQERSSAVNFTCATCDVQRRIEVRTYSPSFQAALESKGLELVHLRLCPASVATKAAVDPNKRVLFQDAVCLKCKQKCTTQRQFDQNKCSRKGPRPKRKACYGLFYRRQAAYSAVGGGAAAKLDAKLL